MKKELYVTAFIMLVLLGVSAAWAQLSNVKTISITSSDLATVTSSSQDISIKVPLWGWFHKSEVEIFTISHTSDFSSVKRVVRVMLLNAGELKQYLRYLIVNVTVYADTEPISYAYLTLTKPEVVIDTTTGDCTKTWHVKVEMWGYAWLTGSGNIEPAFYCEVEPVSVSEG